MMLSLGEVRKVSPKVKQILGTQLIQEEKGLMCPGHVR